MRNPGGHGSLQAPGLAKLIHSRWSRGRGSSPFVTGTQRHERETQAVLLGFEKLSEKFSLLLPA
jgi:hypothetical protein